MCPAQAPAGGSTKPAVPQQWRVTNRLNADPLIRTAARHGRVPGEGVRSTRGMEAQDAEKTALIVRAPGWE
ncbi:hypothetical protein GCM10018966_013780 [Streptomyces yanii]